MPKQPAVIFLMLLLYGYSISFVHAASLVFSAPKKQIEQSEVFPVELRLQNAEGFDTGNVDILFDADIVEVMGIVFSGRWQAQSGFESIDNRNGKVVAMRFYTDKAVDGNWSVATIWLLANKTGTTQLEIRRSANKHARHNKQLSTTGKIMIEVVPLQHVHEHPHQHDHTHHAH